MSAKFAPFQYSHHLSGDSRSLDQHVLRAAVVDDDHSLSASVRLLIGRYAIYKPHAPPHILLWRCHYTTSRFGETRRRWLLLPMS